MRIAVRWRYLIIGSVAACLILGLVGTLLMTPKYTAVTTVEIARETNKITDIQGVERDASVADQEFYQTQYGLLRSRSLAERVASHLRLADDPKFFARYGYKSDSPAFALTGQRYSAAGRPLRLRVAGEILLANAYINPTRLSRLVTSRSRVPTPPSPRRCRTPGRPISSRSTWSAAFRQLPTRARS